jgi:predicted dehydrogenase
MDVREVRPKRAMHQRSLNNGPVLDMAPHFFDLARHFTGQEATQVFAAGHVFARGKGRVRDIPDGELAVDAAEIQVRYGGGHVLSLLLAWGMPEAFPGIHGSQIVGPDGAAYSSKGGFEIVVNGEKETVPGGVTGGGPEPRVNNLAEAIQGRAPLEVTGEDGREALRVSLAAFQSIETGRVIPLDPVGPSASSSE